MGFVEAERSRLPWEFLNMSCREAVNLKRPDGASIDLHHHVPPWLWAQGLTHAALVSRARLVTIEGVSLPVASNEDNLLIASLHIVSDKGLPGESLRIWRDIRLLLSHIDRDAFRSTAADAHLEEWMAGILKVFPEELLPPGTDTLFPGTEHVLGQWRLQHLLRRSSHERHPLMHALRLPPAKAALFLAGMTVPSKRFLSTRYGTPAGCYRRWWRESLRSPGSAPT
jgi:hypothetical protein